MCSEDDFMKILAIADLHAWSTDELHLIADCDADVCCLLGDIPIAAIEVIKQLVHCPIYGILGNHDEMDTLARCGIADLNGKTVTIDGVTFAGLGGSHRYKLGEYPMLTQKESVELSNRCPSADILISHDTAYHIMRMNDTAHCGLKGISRYIRHNKPQMNICGHYHIAKQTKYAKCEIRCIHRCAVIRYPENTMDIIF